MQLPLQCRGKADLWQVISALLMLWGFPVCPGQWQYRNGAAFFGHTIWTYYPKSSQGIYQNGILLHCRHLVSEEFCLSPALGFGWSDQLSCQFPCKEFPAYGTGYSHRLCFLFPGTFFYGSDDLQYHKFLPCGRRDIDHCPGFSASGCERHGSRCRLRHLKTSCSA